MLLRLNDSVGVASVNVIDNNLGVVSLSASPSEGGVGVASMSQ